jgi:hypothetical protein
MPVLTMGVPRRVPFQQDAAGHRVERPQQNDEGNIVGQDDVQDFIYGAAFEGEEKRDAHGGGPEGGYFAEMVMPEIGQQQGHQGDGEQHAGKRDAAPERQNGAQIFMTVMAAVSCCFNVAICRLIRLMIHRRCLGSLGIGFVFGRGHVLRL